MKPKIDFSILGEEAPTQRSSDVLQEKQFTLHEFMGEELLPGDPLFENCPCGNDGKAVQDSPAYQKRIRKCFTDAYKFLEEHKHPRTEKNWEQVAGSLALFTDPLTVDLVLAIVNELEREYKTNSDS